MKSPQKRPQGRGHRGGRVWRCLCVCALVLAGGCRFLADEFTWLDRAAPGTEVPPDAPVTGADGRP